MPETVSPLLVYAGCGAVSYLLGSIPFGYLIAKAVRGIDIREHGSRNIGATNVGRVIGTKYFFIVFVLDALKGFAPVFWMVPYAVHRWMPDMSAAAMIVSVMCGVAVLMGHLWPVTMKFKGGKGVATGAGVTLALHWQACLAAFAMWLAIFLITRIVSCASIAAALAMPVAYAILNRAAGWNSDPLMMFFTTMSILVIYMHRSNIRRLMNGTEARIVWPKKSP